MAALIAMAFYMSSSLPFKLPPCQSLHYIFVLVILCFSHAIYPYPAMNRTWTAGYEGKEVACTFILYNVIQNITLGIRYNNLTKY